MLCHSGIYIINDEHYAGWPPTGTRYVVSSSSIIATTLFSYYMMEFHWLILCVSLPIRGIFVMKTTRLYINFSSLLHQHELQKKIENVYWNMWKNFSMLLHPVMLNLWSVKVIHNCEICTNFFFTKLVLVRLISVYNSW